MEETTQKTTKKTKPRHPKAIRIVVAIVLLALAGLCFWQFTEMQKLRNPNYSQEEAKKEAQKLKDQVSRLMQLPDEEATVATVEDISKLSEQEFFKDAKDGDKVLIFTSAKKAIIYRPSEDHIINSGPIVINSTATEQKTQPEEETKE